MIAQAFWITGAAIFLVLGTMHLVFTFFSDKFLARDANVVTGMKHTSPKITKVITMWQAWISFNATHSLGAMFFGLINITLATAYFQMLTASFALMAISLATSLAYAYIGIRYWFGVPRAGAVLATICFVASAIIMLW